MAVSIKPQVNPSSSFSAFFVAARVMQNATAVASSRCTYIYIYIYIYIYTYITKLALQLAKMYNHTEGKIVNPVKNSWL